MKTVIAACNQIHNNRTADIIKDHLLGEVEELLEEFAKRDAGEPMGEDGIIGEAVDVALCAIDLAAMEIKDPDMRLGMINRIVRKKLNKWLDTYIQY